MINFKILHGGASTRSRDLTSKYPRAGKVFSLKVRVALNLVNSLADIS